MTLHSLQQHIDCKVAQASRHGEGVTGCGSRIHVHVHDAVASDPSLYEQVLHPILPETYEEFKGLQRDYESPNYGFYLSKDAMKERFLLGLDNGLINVKKFVCPSQSGMKRPHVYLEHYNFFPWYAAAASSQVHFCLMPALALAL